MIEFGSRLQLEGWPKDRSRTFKARGDVLFRHMLRGLPPLGAGHPGCEGGIQAGHGTCTKLGGIHLGCIDADFVIIRFAELFNC